MCEKLDRLQELINYIGEKNPLQKKYLLRSMENLSEKEEKEIKDNLNYYLETEHLNIPYLGDSYLLFVHDTLKETKYFVETGHYRYSKQKEVAEKVYYNEDYMRMYILGINLSGYLWVNHRNLHRYYKKVIENDSNIEGEYLEIGTGHGQYFLEALTRKKYKKYLGVDISPASVEATLRYVKKHIYEKLSGEESPEYEVVCEDFLEFDTEHKFDFIVMGEVLEHVENPEIMLKKINSLLTQTGKAYITTVINGPTIDHIYLFRTVEEVLAMMERCGFYIEDYYCTTANNIALEKAIRKAMCINIALVLRKNSL